MENPDLDSFIKFIDSKVDVEKSKAIAYDLMRASMRAYGLTGEDVITREMFHTIVHGILIYQKILGKAYPEYVQEAIAHGLYEQYGAEH